MRTALVSPYSRAKRAAAAQALDDVTGVGGDAIAYAGEEALDLSVHHRLAELGLGADLLVEALPGDPGALGDLGHAQPVPALLGDDRDRGVEESLESQGPELVVEGGCAHVSQS